MMYNFITWLFGLCDHKYEAVGRGYNVNKGMACIHYTYQCRKCHKRTVRKTFYKV